MLAVQKLLLTNEEQGLKTLADLGIDVVFHDQYAVFNYSQISSPNFNEYVDECRGLILEKNYWQFVLLPFKRFYNFGQQESDKSITSLHLYTIQEKLDGTLVSLWYDLHQSKWQVATRKVPYANLPINDLSITFADLFWSAFNKDNIKYLEESYTYTFELCSPYNRIVTHYDTTQLYLLSIRSRSNGEEFHSDFITKNAKRLNVKTPKQYPLANMTDLISSFNEMNNTEEGFVIMKEVKYAMPPISYYYRLKVKNPAYVVLHHLRTSFSLKNFVKLVCGYNEIDEFTASFPEYKPLCDEIKAKFAILISTAEEKQNELLSFNYETRKEYALWIQQLPYQFQSFLFKVLNDRTYSATLHYAEFAQKKPEYFVDLFQLEFFPLNQIEQTVSND